MEPIAAQHSEEEEEEVRRLLLFNQKISQKLF